MDCTSVLLLIVASMLVACSLTVSGEGNKTKEIISQMGSKIHDEISVTLVGGDEYSGTVEINYKGETGVICDDQWDDEDAAVICRMMGYKYRSEATILNAFHYPHASAEFLLDNVQCFGNESYIMDCPHAPWKQHDCNFFEVAGVRCHAAKECLKDEFRCSEHQCIEVGKVCNNENDCLDGSDETNCTAADMCGVRPYDQKDITDFYRLNLRGRDVDERLHDQRTEQNTDDDYSQNKIWNGNFSNHGDTPWQAGLIFTLNGRYVCGAVIISEYWILTAAHCFKMKSEYLFHVSVGDHNKKLNDQGEQMFGVDDIFIHHNYRASGFDYDIALIKVLPNNGKGIQFNDFVQPVCLPTRQTSYKAGHQCVISGWGRTQLGYSADSLKVAMVPLVGWNTCRNMHNRRRAGLITRRMFCAGGIQNGSSTTCPGDSGGPLVCQVDGIFTLFGITSFGWGCPGPNIPYVYSRVSEFLPWIHSVIQSHGKKEKEKALPKRP